MVDFYFKSIVVEELESGNPSFPGRKAMINLDSVLKSRDISLSKSLYSQGYGLPSGQVWLWVGLSRRQSAKESMSSNCGAAESPLDSKEIKPANLKENQPWILIGRTDAEKLKLQYFGHLMRRTDSLEKTLMLGKIEGRRRRGLQKTRWLDGITNWWTWVWASFRRWWWTGKPGMLQSMGSQRVGHDWATELNWSINNSLFSLSPNWSISTKSTF